MLSNSSSRVAKTSCTSTSSSSTTQRLHMSSEMKASSMKSDLTELKSSISEMKNISSVNFNSLRKSVEDLVEMDDAGGGEGNGEPIVTFPDTPDVNGPGNATGMILAPVTSAAATASSTTTESSVKFEQKRMKVVTDQFSAEKEMANSEERRRVQTGEVSYQEQSAAQAMRARLELDGVSAEKSLNMKQVGGLSNSL